MAGARSSSSSFGCQVSFSAVAINGLQLRVPPRQSQVKIRDSVFDLLPQCRKIVRSIVGDRLPSPACVVQQDRSGVLAEISIGHDRRKLDAGLGASASRAHAVLIEKHVLDAVDGNKKPVSEGKDLVVDLHFRG
jgi:hypothetical protein